MLNAKPYRRPDPTKNIPSNDQPPPKVEPKPIRCIGLEQGKQLADQGVAKVSLGFESWLAIARQRAVEFARTAGSVTSDDLHTICPPPPEAHPNLMGAVWKQSQLQPIGYTQSTRPSAHGRVIRVWGLK